MSKSKPIKITNFNTTTEEDIIKTSAITTIVILLLIYFFMHFRIGFNDYPTAMHAEMVPDPQAGWCVWGAGSEHERGFVCTPINATIPGVKIDSSQKGLLLYWK